MGLQRLKLHNTSVPQLASVPPLYMNLVCPGKQGKRCPNFDRPSREKELVEEMLNIDPLVRDQIFARTRSQRSRHQDLSHTHPHARPHRTSTHAQDSAEECVTVRREVEPPALRDPRQLSDSGPIARVWGYDWAMPAVDARGLRLVCDYKRR